MNKQKMAIIGGSALAVIGSILPWATIGTRGISISVGGIQAGGGATLLLAGLCIVFSVLGNKAETVKGWKFWSIFGVAILNTLIAIVKISEITGVSKIGASVGIGLILILVGSAAAAALTFVFKKAE